MTGRVSVATRAKGSANKSVISTVNNDGTKSVEGARRLGQSGLHSKAHPFDSGFGGNTVDDFRTSEAVEVIGIMTTVTVVTTMTTVTAVATTVDVGQSNSDETEESNKDDFVHG